MIVFGNFFKKSPPKLQYFEAKNSDEQSVIDFCLILCNLYKTAELQFSNKTIIIIKLKVFINLFPDYDFFSILETKLLALGDCLSSHNYRTSPGRE